jgi:hypothetical protein
MIDLHLESSNAVFRPKSRIRGSLAWEVSKAPKDVRLILNWHTEGKGTEDREIAIEQAWESSDLVGKVRFDWELPIGPYSLQGRLVQIRWKLLAEIRWSKTFGYTTEEKELSIILSPIDQVIYLRSPVP